jgi:hypothetical protein
LITCAYRGDSPAKNRKEFSGIRLEIRWRAPKSSVIEFLGEIKEWTHQIIR